MNAPGGWFRIQRPLIMLLVLVGSDRVDPLYALLPRTHTRLRHDTASAFWGRGVSRRTSGGCSSLLPGRQRRRRGSPSRTTATSTSIAIDPWNDDRSIPIVLENKVQWIGGEAPKSTNDESSPATPIDSTSSSSAWINASTAILWLNVVAILWGTQHAVIKTVVTDGETSAAAFTLCRFALAAALALPAGITQVYQRSKGGEDEAYEASLLSTTDDATADTTTTLGSTSNTSTSTGLVTLARWGAELGWWMFLGFGFQAIGLETTTAQKSGFLLYLNVKFVPLFAWWGLGRSISRATWISAAAAFLGTTLLGGLWEPVLGLADSSSLTDAQRWNVGDIWSLAAAAASAMFILRLEFASRALPQQAAALNAASLVAVTVLATAWTLAVDPATDLLPSLSHLLTTHSWEFLYLAGVTTALANGIQTAAQAYVPAERASLIYAMDPVYGAFFAYLWLGESLPGVAGWVGASLVATAAASNAWLDLKPALEEDESIKT